MRPKGPGFVVLYRWRLREGMEAAFIEAWSRLSQGLLTKHGSLGSRLHKCADGLWYSYAQWPSAQAREIAFSSAPVDHEASAKMKEAIAESFPELVLESVSDFMVLPPRSDT
jgi:heme-degrading monooxygenase HmoA